MKNYLPRVLEPHIRRYLTGFPVLGLTGPRQSGKSTLLQHVLPDYQYVSFDDIKLVDYFQQDPDGFIARYNNRVIFDEVQTVPALFHYIKLAVDKDRQNYGKFILTGSSQFSFLQKVSESLAGRIGLLSLLPLQFSEIPASQRRSALIHGSYPELVLRDYWLSEEWYASYFDTYLNKDVRQLTNIGDMRDFQRFILLLAANASQQLVMSNYAKELGVSVPTIKRWLSILEASYIIFLLPPYFKNYGKRLTKSPKIYFYDTGIITYLTGIKTFEHYDQGPLAGALFENYVIAEIYKRELHNKTLADLSYFRVAGGVEVDLIVDRKTHKELFEIKKSATFKVAMLDSMQSIMEPQDKGFLLYNGETLPNGSSIDIVNYQEFLALTPPI
jgi:predicted AAA+ superfamily ATPase